MDRPPDAGVRARGFTCNSRQIATERPFCQGLIRRKAGDLACTIRATSNPGQTATGDLLSATLEVRRTNPGFVDWVSAPYLSGLQVALARGRAGPDAESRLREPPSGREMEVLALVAAGESNREIAGRLFVSTSTVKTHVNNLYRKLDAHGRTQAVARARELGRV